jgi:isopentenyl-diphosphate Delta-isomerase
VNISISGRADYGVSAGFDRYRFNHNALSECSLDQVDLRVHFLDNTFSSPLFISSMTGGYAEGESINAIIARFCERNQIPFGLGSMRAMLEDEQWIPSFTIARKNAPNSFIAANIGGVQLKEGLSRTFIDKLVDVIQANALIVHLNPLQELMQPEGDRNFEGIKEALTSLISMSPVPVIVKETGAGISGLVARELYHDCGVRVIDVAGAGGTSWARVENLRRTDEAVESDAQLFNDWGIPTVDCLTDIKAQHLPDLFLISSGGIRNAHDIIKSFCMGAHMSAMAAEVIKTIHSGGEEGLQLWYDRIQRHLKMTLCLLGVNSLNECGMQLLSRR